LARPGVYSTGLSFSRFAVTRRFFRNRVVIPGFGGVQRPSKCSSARVSSSTCSNASCQLGIIPGSGRRRGFPEKHDRFQADSSAVRFTANGDSPPRTRAFLATADASPPGFARHPFKVCSLLVSRNVTCDPTTRQG